MTFLKLMFGVCAGVTAVNYFLYRGGRIRKEEFAGAVFGQIVVYLGCIAAVWLGY